MKVKFLLLLTMLVSIVTYAQKNEIKAAEKELKKGNAQEAITILNSIEPQVQTALDPEKSSYYFALGNAHYDLVNKKIDEETNIYAAIKAYRTLIEVEAASGKQKNTKKATENLMDIKTKLLTIAIESSTKQDYAKSAKELYEVYQLDKKDTINLYYSASTYLNAKDYASALKVYEELKTINYSGKDTYYFATNKANGAEERFPTKKERDTYVKLGTHEKPREEEEPSKRGEIYKNMALILVQDGKVEEAKKAIVDARAANPEDITLIVTQANLYLETKDYETYQKLIKEVLEKNPTDVDLIFNLGVLSAQAKDTAEAEKYYKRAIELDPNYVNAYINLTALKLEDESAIMTEMNKLGTSAKDQKRYDELNAKRKELYKSIIPYLKKAVELDPKNPDTAKTLLTVYSALEMTKEYKELKEQVNSNK